MRTPSLVQNAHAQRGAKRVLRQEIDWSSEPFFEIVLEANHCEEAYGATELHDQVDVTVFACFTPRDRAEEEERLNASPGNRPTHQLVRRPRFPSIA
jgi:hypothetical protein